MKQKDLEGKDTQRLTSKTSLALMIHSTNTLDLWPPARQAGSWEYLNEAKSLSLWS